MQARLVQLYQAVLVYLRGDNGNGSAPNIIEDYNRPVSSADVANRYWAYDDYVEFTVNSSGSTNPFAVRVSATSSQTYTVIAKYREDWANGV